MGRVVIGSDQKAGVMETVVSYFRQRGHEIELVGALAGEPNARWPEVGSLVAQKVARGEATTGVVACFTGTGVAMAANKVHGVRAALCHDAGAAQGARLWNHANVLALSIRSTTAQVGIEICDAWMATPDDPEFIRDVSYLDKLVGGDGI